MTLDDSIRYIDFHTHHGRGSSDTVAIVNILAGDSVPESFPRNTLFSAGIHPWFAEKMTAEMQKSELILTMAHPHVIAIGEAGFDTLRGPSQEVQSDIFSFQASLAEELGKPLIIHCVRAWDLITGAHKRLKPSVPWIIHGFRGKTSLAVSLTGEGFLISLGKNSITEELMKMIDTDRIFLETDDSNESVTEVYSLFCKVTGMEMEQASEIFRKNFNRLIGA